MCFSHENLFFVGPESGLKQFANKNYPFCQHPHHFVAWDHQKWHHEPNKPSQLSWVVNLDGRMVHYVKFGHFHDSQWWQQTAIYAQHTLYIHTLYNTYCIFIQIYTYTLICIYACIDMEHLWNGDLRDIFSNVKRGSTFDCTAFWKSRPGYLILDRLPAMLANCLRLTDSRGSHSFLHVGMVAGSHKYLPNPSKSLKIQLASWGGCQVSWCSAETARSGKPSGDFVPEVQCYHPACYPHNCFIHVHVLNIPVASVWCILIDHCLGSTRETQPLWFTSGTSGNWYL